MPARADGFQPIGLSYKLATAVQGALPKLRLHRQSLLVFDSSILVPLTPEENERRFKECMKWIHNLTHEELVKLMGEDWLENYRRQFP